MTSAVNQEGPIILFDGVCHLCTSAIQFVIQRDSQKRFRFASLQSPVADALIGQREPEQKRLTSMVLVMNGQTYRQSTAALLTARQLDGLWPLLGIFLFIPTPIRDAVYRWIGARRYNIFGKHETCWVPGQDMADRFL